MNHMIRYDTHVLAYPYSNMVHELQKVLRLEDSRAILRMDTGFSLSLSMY